MAYKQNGFRRNECRWRPTDKPRVCEGNGEALVASRRKYLFLEGGSTTGAGNLHFQSFSDRENLESAFHHQRGTFNTGPQSFGGGGGGEPEDIAAVVAVGGINRLLATHEDPLAAVLGRAVSVSLWMGGGGGVGIIGWRLLRVVNHPWGVEDFGAFCSGVHGHVPGSVMSGIVEGCGGRASVFQGYISRGSSTLFQGLPPPHPTHPTTPNPHQQYQPGNAAHHRLLPFGDPCVHSPVSLPTSSVAESTLQTPNCTVRGMTSCEVDTTGAVCRNAKRWD